MTTLFPMDPFVRRCSQVQFEEARQYSEDNGLIHMETSAKSAQNVKNIFVEIGEREDIGKRDFGQGVCVRFCPALSYEVGIRRRGWCCPLQDVPARRGFRRRYVEEVASHGELASSIVVYFVLPLQQGCNNPTSIACDVKYPLTACCLYF